MQQKYFWKKLATVRGMLTEQIFELRGPNVYSENLKVPGAQLNVNLPGQQHGL